MSVLCTKNNNDVGEVMSY